MKIGIYNPYFDSFGGGERYIWTLASYWSTMHTVDVFWHDKTITQASEDRFGLDLTKVHVVSNVFTNRNFIKKLLVTSTYDLIVFLTDGSVPMSLAKRNVLHIQVPFAHVPMNQWKKDRYQYIVCNSLFTSDHVDTTLTIPKVVIYPPVSIENRDLGNKEHMILSVGRFNGQYNVKKQDILIDAFKKLSKKIAFRGWKLVFVGSMLPSDEAFINKLREQAKGYAIEFLVNASYETLQTQYQKASLYWHAAGFGESNPEHMEHFGISTVEALGYGCTVYAFNGGGQKEIITDGVNGYLWDTPEELLTKTCMKKTNTVELTKSAKLRALDFSSKSFTDTFDALLRKLF